MSTPRAEWTAMSSLTPTWPSRPVRGASALAVALLAAAWLLAASAAALPDNRVYEAVTPLEEQTSAVPIGGFPSTDGKAVDWEAVSGLGDSTSGGITYFQSRRTPGAGWRTAALTPDPPKPLGALEEQAPMFWSADLEKTIFLTPSEYAPGDREGGALGLYLASAGGQVTWVSQGEIGGTAPDEVTFDGATPDAEQIVFSTAESLTANASGLNATGPEGSPRDYLYVRDVPTGKTHLVDVNEQGQLLDGEGAILGNGGMLAFGEPPDYNYIPADSGGTTTHAISNDGAKLFFESPPPGAASSTHLYMRENNTRTVAIDNPEASGSARYAGAAENGSLVFFTSDEGLAGDPNTDNELYAFNTNTGTLSVISAGAAGTADGNVVGVTAIANNGARVYFIARGLLAANAGAAGGQAREGDPNLYLYDTQTAQTTFVADLLAPKYEAEAPARKEPPHAGVEALTAEPDVGRAAVPTPTGGVLVFDSNANLTGHNEAERYFELYRYDAATGALLCISCVPAGNASPGSDATLGGGGGGSYAPPGHSTPMSENGERIFFESSDPLVPEDTNPDRPPEASKRGETEVYEWENGTVSLISDGAAAVASGLDGTTPSGDDVFFTTSAALVAQDLNPGYFNIYDARVLQPGETPPATAAGTPPAPCEAADCRNPTPPAPLFVPPASASLLGAGNPSAPPPVSKPVIEQRRGHRATRAAHKRRSVNHRRKKSAGGAGGRSPTRRKGAQA